MLKEQLEKLFERTREQVDEQLLDIMHVITCFYTRNILWDDTLTGKGKGKGGRKGSTMSKRSRKSGKSKGSKKGGKKKRLHG